METAIATNELTNVYVPHLGDVKLPILPEDHSWKVSYTGEDLMGFLDGDEWMLYILKNEEVILSDKMNSDPYNIETLDCQITASYLMEYLNRM